GVYPSVHGQDLAVSEAIAARFPGIVLHVLVHDDDFLSYLLYRDGRRLDQYSSRPNALGGPEFGVVADWRGRPGSFRGLLADDRLVELEGLLTSASADH